MYFRKDSFLRIYVVPFLATIAIMIFAWRYRNTVPVWWIIFVITILVGYYYTYFRKCKNWD